MVGYSYEISIVTREKISGGSGLPLDRFSLLQSAGRQAGRAFGQVGR